MAKRGGAEQLEEEEDWFTYYAEDDETCTMIVYVCSAWIPTLRTSYALSCACACVGFGHLPCSCLRCHECARGAQRGFLGVRRTVY